MEITDFKNIVGQTKSGDVAVIRFFGKITEESAMQFNSEFDYLENCVKPSLIRVLINCEGGSVLYGMSSYSAIRNSAIPTECVNEGMAASMGSVLWAAGDKSLMRDYSILMIHNPFLPSSEDSTPSDLITAFTKQIKTIYRKRFGLKADHVEAIMNGEAGKDGTFFDAAAAVKAGIIPTENILHTSKQLCDKVKNQLASITEASEIQDMMAQVSAEVGADCQIHKHFPATTPIPYQTNKNQPMSEVATQSAEYAAVAATLGLKDKSEVKDVMARISELMAMEAKLTEAQKSLSDTQTVIAGKDATIGNLQKSVTDLTESLKAFQDKEAAEAAARIDALIDGAIGAGKLDKAKRADWIAMAQANYTLAESILATIPASEKISAQIASDPANIQAAAEATKTAETQMAEKVTTVVGETFEFKKIE